MKKFILSITLILGIHFCVNALPGNALYFDGTNDYVSVSDNDESISTNQAFTIEAWIRWEASSPTTQFICGKGIEQMEIHTTVNNGIRFIPTTGVYLDVDNVLTTGKWTHIAVVYDPSQSLAKIYINAREKAWLNNGLNLETTAIENTSTDFFIGQRSDGTYPFEGAIDELSIFDVALDQSRINDHMNSWYSSYNNNTEGIVNLFKFDQGTASSNNTAITTLNDEYEGSDGTLYNFALSGNTSNWIESYAKVIPSADAASDITSASFKANWLLTENGEDNIDQSSVEHYQLYVATDSLFTNMLIGYPVNLLDNNEMFHSHTVSGVDPTNNLYYYRITADSTGFEGQGAYSNTVRVGSIFEVSPTNILLDYTLGSKSTFQILADKEWGILNTPTWLTLDTWLFGGGGDQLVTATANTDNNSGENRKATLTLTSDGMDDLSVEIIQSCTPPDNTLNFDGVDDYVELENTFQSTNNLTIETWVYWEGDNNSTYQFIFKNGNSATSGYALLITADGIINSMCSGKLMMTSDTVLTPNIWQHVSLVRNNDTWTLYLNGNAQTLSNNTTTPYTPNGTFTIGAAESGNSSFNGSMDEFKDWNTTRSESQIKSGMYSTLTGNETALYSYFQFRNGISKGDNSTSVNLFDKTGNNNGTLFNFALNGSKSNWIESYAMVVPQLVAPSNITYSYFTANWTAPSMGTVDNYELEVATDSSFTNLVEGYNPLVLDATETSHTVSDINLLTKYYYRVRANKSSVNGQGSYSAVQDIVISTEPVPISKWWTASIFLLLGLTFYIKKARH